MWALNKSMIQTTCFCNNAGEDKIKDSPYPGKNEGGEEHLVVT